MTTKDQHLRAVIYARVSTKDQDYNMQIKDLENYARQRNWTIVRKFAEKASGASDDRPEYQALLDFTEKRLCDVILVWKFDRFSRSMFELVSNLNRFQEIGVDFCSYHENIDTTGVAGKIVFSLFAGLAELEREHMRTRVKRGIEYAKVHGTKSGEPHGRPTTSAEKLRACIPMMWERLTDPAEAYLPVQIQRKCGIKQGVYYQVMNTLTALKEGETDRDALIKISRSKRLFERIHSTCRLLKLELAIFE